jgi:hypothetical protein
MSVALKSSQSQRAQRRISGRGPRFLIGARPEVGPRNLDGKDA